MSDDSIHKNPDSERLKRKLLSIGGEAAVIRFEQDLEKLMNRGTLFSGELATMRVGEPSSCHVNAAANFLEFGDHIATGYALSTGGVWRQHSWNVDAVAGNVIETTEPRLVYFGFVLDEAESKTFAEQNSESSIVRRCDDDDAECIDFVFIIRSNESVLLEDTDGMLEIRSRRTVDESVLGKIVWIVEYDSVTGGFGFRGSLLVEEIDLDDDREFPMILSGTEFTLSESPMPVCEPVTLDLLTNLTRTNSSVCIELADDGAEVSEFRSLNRSLYGDIDEE